MVFSTRSLLCLLMTLFLLLTSCALQSMQITQRLQQPIPPRPTASAFRENQVQIGMTTAEVRVLLPEPETIDKVANGTWWGYFYSDDEIYFIRFTQGVVVHLVKSTKKELQPIYLPGTPAQRL